MSENYEDYKNNLNEMVEATVAGIEKKLIRNILISFLFILVPSLFHFFTSENVLGSIFVLLTTSSLTIVFWLIFSEMNQRHSMAVLSAQIEVVAKKHY